MRYKPLSKISNPQTAIANSNSTVMYSLLAIGLAIFGIGTISPKATTAQTSPQSPTPDNTIPLPLIQATPLVQATSTLLGRSSYYIESEIEIRDRLSNTSVSNALIKTTVAAPNKFNTEIAFVGNNELLDRKYQIISDGVKVWIYDVVQNQYSVEQYQQFIESPSGLAVGMLSNFYLKTLNSVNNNTVAVNTLKKLPPERSLRYFQRFANIDLQNMEIRNEQIEDTAYAVYDADASDGSFELTAYVAPQSAIERIELSGNKDGLDLIVKEQIISQTVPESIPADLFSFSPPEDAEVIEQIAIEP